MEDPFRYLQRLEAVRTSLRWVHGALLNPGTDVWELCAPELDGALEQLTAIEQQLRADSAPGLELKAEVRRQIAGLRHDLTRVHTLMEAAADSYLGWAQMLAAAVNGYSGSGTVPPIGAPTAVSVQG